jgi:hypothetical protein
MNATLPELGHTDFTGLAAREKLTGNLPFGGTTAWVFEVNLPAVAEPLNRLHRRAFMSGITIAESVQKTTVETAASLSAQLRQKINELAALESNWDGETAKPVKPHVLADVAETLKRLGQQTDVFHEPFLAPTFDGFVQMEWREDKRYLDIEAVEKGWAAIGTMIGSDGQRHYYTAEFERNDFAQFANFYQWLYGNELIWPSL